MRSLIQATGSTPRGCNGSVATSIQTMSAPRHSLRSCTANQEVVPQTISPQARLIRGLRRMEQIRAQVYLVCAEATVYCRPCLQLDAQGPHVHCLAMLLAWGYSGCADCTTSNAMTFAAAAAGPLPAPIRCDAIAAGRPFFVSTLGQPPIERKAMPDAPGMDPRLHPARRNYA
jgi:hypothetical protein